MKTLGIAEDQFGLQENEPRGSSLSAIPHILAKIKRQIASSAARRTRRFVEENNAQ
jgi:hypothetical protein